MSDAERCPVCGGTRWVIIRAEEVGLGRPCPACELDAAPFPSGTGYITDKAWEDRCRRAEYLLARVRFSQTADYPCQVGKGTVRAILKHADRYSVPMFENGTPEPDWFAEDSKEG